MTEWTEQYERKNQLHLHVVELWNMDRKSSRGHCPKKLKDRVAWVIKKLLQERKVVDVCLKKNMTLQVLH
jgi:hypothetical protein